MVLNSKYRLAELQTAKLLDGWTPELTKHEPTKYTRDGTRAAEAVTTETPKLLLSTPEVARALGVSERYIKQLIHTGSLRSLRVGRLRRVGVDDLRDWIERQRAADRPMGPEAHR